MSSARTAIHRKKLSAPAQWLLDEGLLRAPVLDFGCGHGDLGKFVDLGVESWDPHWQPGAGSKALAGRFETVACLYVLCVLPPGERLDPLEAAYRCVRPGGNLYVAVRRDIDADGATSRGWQGNVVLHAPVVFERSKRFCIYKYAKPR